MAKEELMQFDGLVIEILPDARYRVQLDQGHEIVAYTAGKMKKNRIKTLAGDRVTVEMSPTISRRAASCSVTRTSAPPARARRSADSSAAAERGCRPDLGWHGISVMTMRQWSSLLSSAGRTSA